MFEAELVEFLQNKEELSAVISDRLYADEPPEGELVPTLIYQDGGIKRFGTLGHTASMVEHDIYFIVITDTKIQGKVIAKILFQNLANYSGQLVDGGINVQAVHVLDERSEKDGNQYLTHIDFKFKYNE